MPNIEHPEDWKEITQQIEEEERKKKRKRKLIIIPSVIAGTVALTLFFTLGLPAIINAASRAANKKPAEIVLVNETIAGESVYDEYNNQWLVAWSGTVKNVSDKSKHALVEVHAKYSNNEWKVHSYTTGLIMPGGLGGYAIMAQEQMTPIESFISVFSK